MAATKFFHKLATPIKTFIGMKSPKRSNEKQEIPILFRIGLNGNNIRSAPKFVQDAYPDALKGTEFSWPKKSIENVNVELFNLPESKRASFVLPRVTLEGLELRQTANSEGDTSVVLLFHTEYPWDHEIWEYLGDHYSSDVFTRFDSAQATLLDVEEEEEKGEDQPELVETPPAA